MLPIAPVGTSGHAAAKPTANAIGRFGSRDETRLQPNETPPTTRRFSQSLTDTSRTFDVMRFNRLSAIEPFRVSAFQILNEVSLMDASH